MPANIVYGQMNALAAIAKLGVPQKLYDWAKNCPHLTIKLKDKKFIFAIAVDDVSGKNYGMEKEVPVTIGQLQQINAGTLPGSIKTQLQQDVAKVLLEAKTVVEKVTGQKVPLNVDATITAVSEEGAVTHHIHSVHKPSDLINAKTEVVKQGVFAELPPLEEDGLAQTVTVAAWDVFPRDKMHSAGMVPLGAAKMLYQPVAGSSQGSRYFCVAATKNLRVAARYKATPNGGTLSVRIEAVPGVEIAKWAKQIVAAGFDQPKSNYASVHLDCTTPLLAAKTLGAVLLGLGLTYETPTPNMKTIISTGFGT